MNYLLNRIVITILLMNGSFAHLSIYTTSYSQETDTVRNGKPASEEAHHYLKLESGMLALVDGNFLNADTLERVFSFKKEVLDILWGIKQPDGSRKGKYLVDNATHSADELAKRENKHLNISASTKKQFDLCLQAMKRDFLASSDKLKSIARGAKPAMGVLIEESCKKRNRLDSILLLWAHTPEEEEDRIFDEKVKTINCFARFCIDLLDFVGDLLSSCPKALKQFKQRTEKWKLFESILTSQLGHTKPNINFLKYVKQHIDSFSLDQITVTTVQQWLNNFNKRSRENG